MSFDCTLEDADDVLGLGHAEVDVRLEYEVDPGWPDSPPAVEVTNVEVLRVTGGPVARERLRVIEQWAADEVDRKHTTLRRQILEGEA